MLAALEGTGDLAVLQAAGAGQREADDLAPAEQAGLVHVEEDTGRLAFCHPLIRSAVLQLSVNKSCAGPTGRWPPSSAISPSGERGIWPARPSDRTRK